MFLFLFELIVLFQIKQSGSTLFYCPILTITYWTMDFHAE